MKLYILTSKLLAEKASQADAEEVIGRKINNFLYGTEGYITKDPDTQELDWMPKSLFDKKAELYDSPIDKYQRSIGEIDKSIKYLYTQSCSARPKSDKRNKIYLAIRRLKALKQDLEHIINLEIQEL